MGSDRRPHMDSIFTDALQRGYERLCAWSGLLDRINVFPVADADTGRNLKISLAPLCWTGHVDKTRTRELMMAATGNSGNIAAAFFAPMLMVENWKALGPAIDRGRNQARGAVGSPQPGTMLSVFDALGKVWPADAQKAPGCETIVHHLESAVSETADILPEMKAAGVVDAGALGMFLFLETFFIHLLHSPLSIRPVTDIFPGHLTPAPGWKTYSPQTAVVCVNTTIASDLSTAKVRQALAGSGESMVLAADRNRFKLHLHTDNSRSLRRQVAAMGRVLAWSAETTAPVPERTGTPAGIHIMTDAAGSMTPEDARELGITLLNSYLIVENQRWPETLYEPAGLYQAMARGIPVSTAQASLFERHQSYLSAIRRYDKVLYLCVGSAFTGNCEAARTWQARSDRQNQFTVIDTGAASGRLGLIAMIVGRFAQTAGNPQAVIDFAQKAVMQCREFVFLDQLKYLAAGGRLSKTRGFIGDLLHLKPVISPTAEGAVKVAVLRSRKDQLDFAMQRLEENLADAATPVIMLQFSDNRLWVETRAADRISALWPGAEIIVRPLSLTSGAHMGPGTWALAFFPVGDPGPG